MFTELLFLRCRIPSFCKPSGKLIKINPANQLIVQSDCIDGFSRSTALFYEHKLYLRKTSNQNWEPLNGSMIDFYTLGSKSKEFTIIPNLFQIYPSILQWRIELVIQSTFQDNSTTYGLAVMNLKINEKPYNGSCLLNTTTGFALYTYFEIECGNWTDNDGFIVRYEYFAKYSDGSSPMAINYNTEGNLKTQLPQGLKSDSYKLYIFVQVIDDSDAITVFEIPEPVVVEVKPGFVDELSQQLLNNPENSNFLKEIKLIIILLFSPA